MEIPSRAPSIARATSCLWREEEIWGRRDYSPTPHEQGKGNCFSIPQKWTPQPSSLAKPSLKCFNMPFLGLFTLFPILDLSPNQENWQKHTEIYKDRLHHIELNQGPSDPGNLGPHPILLSVLFRRHHKQTYLQR